MISKGQAAAISKTQNKLESILEELKQTKDLAQAKTLAHEFLDNCCMKKKVDQLKRSVDREPTVARVVQLCYYTMLSGEGLGAKAA